MANTASFEERVTLAEAYLLCKARNAQRNTPIMNAAIYMFRTNGARRLENITSQLSLGLRQFERNFVREVGLTPKLFSRVARFQTALDTRIHREDARWVSLANEFGYHDQMHMIKDFQKLSGLSPEQLLSQIGDMRPTAMIGAADQNHHSIRSREDHGQTGT